MSILAISETQVSKKGPNSPLTKGYLFQNKKVVAILRFLNFCASFFLRPRLFPAQISKILVIKPDHLGDLLITTSVLPRIREFFPLAEVDIIINPSSEVILRSNPSINKVYTFRHFLHNRSALSSYKKLFAHFQDSYRIKKLLKSRHYDLCLVLRAHGGGLIPVARGLGCKFILGYKTGGFSSWLDEDLDWSEGQPEARLQEAVIVRAAELAGKTKFSSTLAKTSNDDSLQSTKAELFYQFYPGLEAEEKVDLLLSELWGIQREELPGFYKNLLVFHPGAGDLRKTLSTKNWKYIIDAAKKADFSIAFTGSGGEKAFLDDLALSEIIRLDGKLSLLELGALYKKVAGIVTIDSLSAHMSAWSERPSLVFFCGINDSRQWKPLGTKVRVLENPVVCRPCYKGCVTMDCMVFSESFIKKEVEDFFNACKKS